MKQLAVRVLDCLTTFVRFLNHADVLFNAFIVFATYEMPNTQTKMYKDIVHLYVLLILVDGIIFTSHVLAMHNSDNQLDLL